VTQLNNPLEIYKYLQKSNCRQCHVPSCLAFAASVIKGQKKLDDCPHLDCGIIELLNARIDKPVTHDQQQVQSMEQSRQLKRAIATIDFFSSAKRLGASLLGDKLVIKCLGKDFTVDPEGNITSDCHINAWVTVPLLNYILSSVGKRVSGKWVPFRELKNGMKWNPLFNQRCEKALKKVADINVDLFEYILRIFGGKSANISFFSDISLVLHPLPKVPILFSYCKPEDDLESRLNVFFDSTAEENLNIESIYLIGAGLATMFEKITFRHN